MRKLSLRLTKWYFKGMTRKQRELRTFQVGKRLAAKHHGWLYHKPSHVWESQ